MAAHLPGFQKVREGTALLHVSFAGFVIFSAVSACGWQRDSSDGPKRGDGGPDIRCGAYCIYAALTALDVEMPKFTEFEKSLGPIPAGGFSMGALAAAAERYGAQTLGVSTTIANLRKRKERLACVVLINQGHFVIVTGADESAMQMIDPSSMEPEIQSVPLDSWRAIWNGEALLISRQPLVPEEDLPRDISWANLAGYAGLAVGALLLLYIAAWAIKKSGKGKMAI